MSNMEEKLQEMMDTIRSTQWELKADFTEQISKLKREVTAGQESSSQEVVKKLNKRTYHFQRKGNEAQYLFNSSVEDHLESAKKELAKLTPENDVQTATVKRVKTCLDEGTKAIEVRQKHIKIADRSELGWAVVAAYEDDELASDSEDEKRIYKAEREAERLSKRNRAWSSAAAKKKVPTTGAVENTMPGPSRGATGNQNVGACPVRPRIIGPCFRCGEWGHLVANCAKPKQQYPSRQPLVRGAVNNVHDVHTVCVNDFELDAFYEIDKSCVSTKGIDGETDKVLSGVTASIQQEAGSLGETGNAEVSALIPIDASDEYPATWDSKYWEIQDEVLGPQIEDVQGRVRKNLSFWREVLKASDNVLDTIQSGYKLPLLYMPDSFCKGNHSSTQVHAKFVTESISKLLANRCIKRVEHKPFICSPLSVVGNADEKLRLVLNLRYLNQFLQKFKFKYEDLKVALLMFTREDFLFKFDLKSGYHHLDIFEPHQKYLGFAWEFDNNTSYFRFTVMPFGLSTACYAFTKFMRPLVKYWRSRGLRTVLYLDDGIVAVKGKENADRESSLVRQDLTKAGLIANDAKSQWTPVKKLTWLGFEIEIERGILSVPEQKLSNLTSQLRKANEVQVVPATVLASIIGKVLSMALALGPVMRLMTRNLYAMLNARSSWYQNLSVTREARAELAFWLEHIEKFNGQNMWPGPSAVRVVYSDASSTGYGGYCIEHGDQVTAGQWLPQEALRSSTWRELRAVRLVLEDFGPKLKNCRVRWLTDNQNVVRIVLYGSRKPILQEEALAIFATGVNNRIRLEPEWIPREENEFADYLSRIVDHDDWMLNPVVFQELDVMWGPHTIDRFADVHNRQLERFNSRYWNPWSEAVDAFTCDWSRE